MPFRLSSNQRTQLFSISPEILTLFLLMSRREHNSLKNVRIGVVCTGLEHRMVYSIPDMWVVIGNDRALKDTSFESRDPEKNMS